MNPPTEPEEKMCVKALAFSLGVSVRYVYEMRRYGFTMTGVHQASTHKQAVDWIEETDFKMVNGVGVVQKSAKPAA